MSIAKIQKGDNIQVIAGNYKGTKGVVTKIINKKNRKGILISTRAIISTIPKIVKYRAKQRNNGETYPGAKLETDRTINVSNLQLITPDGIVSRVKIEVQNGKKVRVYKKNSQVVEKVKVATPKKVEFTDSETQVTDVEVVESTKLKSKKTKQDN
jgi:large subunit ribosomal protein L24